ncbi:MAG: TIR domain-containing protein [Acidobacteria bacterium]|nr:TIR domain-containing protein [Acidobacteriota bacterium]
MAKSLETQIQRARLLVETAAHGHFIVVNYKTLDDRDHAAGLLKQALGPAQVREFHFSADNDNPLPFLRGIPPVPPVCAFLYDPVTRESFGYLNIGREKVFGQPHTVFLFVDNDAFRRLLTEAPDIMSRRAMVIVAQDVAPEYLSPDGRKRVFISYAVRDGADFARQFRHRLHTADPMLPVWQDIVALRGGDTWRNAIFRALDQVDCVALILTPLALQSEWVKKETLYARQRGVRVIPIRQPGLATGDIPEWIRNLQIVTLSFDDADTSQWSALLHDLQHPRPVERVPYLAPDPPDGYVDRPEQIQRVKQFLLEGKRAAITTALQGAGGFGKTTLAARICTDDDILGHFFDGVLWTTLGQTPSVTAELQRWGEAMTGERPQWANEVEAVDKMRALLANKRTLLVIDDAWQRSPLQAFLDVAGRDCACLVTTRELDLVAGLQPVRVDEMTFEQSLELLGCGRIPEAGRLARRLNGWALLVELTAHRIRKEMQSENASINRALDYIHKALDKRGLGAVDRTNPRDRNESVSISLRLSLEALRDLEPRYRGLGIFPEDTDIPVSVAAALWGVDEFDAGEWLRRFQELALVRIDAGRETFRFHDVVLEWLARELGPQAAFLHGKLLDAWGDPRHLTSNYAWRQLGWHLRAAGRRVEWDKLRLDLEWLEAKLAATGVNTLEEDFAGSPQGPYRLMERALMQSSHILARDKAQLPGQLCARLVGVDEPQLDDLKAKCRARLIMVPRWPSLAQAGDPLIRTLEGHAGGVRSVAVSADGATVYSGSADNTVKVWEAHTGRLLRTLEGHAREVTSVAVSADGATVYSGSADKTVKVWEAHTGRLLRTLEGHAGAVLSVAVSADGATVYSGSDDKTVKVWEAHTGSPLRTLRGHAGVVRSVAVSADGATVYSGSADNTVKVWEAHTGRLLRTLEGHSGRVRSVAVFADGATLYSGSSDQTVKVWEAHTGRLLRTLHGHADWVWSVAVSADGATVYSASRDKLIKLWNPHTGECLQTFTGDSSFTCLSLAQNTLAAGDEAGRVHVFDLRQDALNRCAAPPPDQSVSPATPAPNSPPPSPPTGTNSTPQT